MEITNNNVYIKSVEGSEVYEHMYRGKDFHGSYVGMLPFSLEQIKLTETGMKVFKSKRFNKVMSNDIINLKFKQKVKSNEQIIQILGKKIKDSKIDSVKLLENIDKLHIEIDYEKIKDTIDKKTGEITEKGLVTILTEKGFNEDSINYIRTLAHIKELGTKKDWKEIKVDDVEDKKTGEITTDGLRTILYKNGFQIAEIINKKDKNGKIMVDEETGEVLTELQVNEYVAFARSSAKSRTGQVLFIRKGKLHDDMIKWMRLGMNLEDDADINFPALLSYESLVGSSLEDKLEIPVDNILIISDVKSIFKIDCNVVAKNKTTDLLESVLTKDYNMESDIFDGEGILDSSYFVEDRADKGFILARQHMFKSALFNGEVITFLKDYAFENGIDFDTWEIENIFHEKMLASNVHCIITPNSLKALKFSNKKGSKPKMWRHWKYLIKKEKNIFGICKSEKESHRGKDKDGKILNQTSYQMLNSMPYSHDGIEELSKFERDYIKQLKNNNDVYVKFLTKEANNMNCNEMLVDLYKHNNDIVGIKTFKDKRKKDIHNYVAHAKKGKLRLNGDYCTIIQNGREFLYHAIGKLPVNKGILDLDAWESHMILKGNQVYTTLHEFGREFVGFRNPHTSPSNVLIIENTDSQFIKDYFNLTDNIIYTNAIDFPINRILSGQDVDSDNLVVFDSIKMLQIARECYIQSETSNYKVCENGVDKEDNKYKVCNADMAKIDGILAKSQKYIGTVVNLGQLYMSAYWDSINKDEKDEDKQNKLLQGVDICTILSEISIDMAKRLYKVDIKTQIENLEKCEYLKEKKPLFFKYISKSKNIEDNSEKYETSMDYLYEILNKIEDAEDIDTVQIEDFLESTDDKKIKDRQVNGIVKAINDMSTSIKHIEGKYKGTSDSDKEERYIALDSTRNEHLQIVGRYKIKTATVIVIINKVFRDRLDCKYKTDLLNTLYVKSPIEFINAFKIKKL
ncbi:hypothetical protein [Clostridium estertheticum]|uniref:hypothetical protein n=1 Tax=Clostridium estertheticum TaxID=238834 RepID=UPI001CF10414|nr:hypothetical protein [Clostridium estertheticum]MCB2340879.1 hypothetical protein [Clostridium estertheticum]